MTLPHEPTAIVRDALADLRPFQIVDRATAGAVLAMWCRRTELENADIRAILAAFPDPTADRGAELRDEMAAGYDPTSMPRLSNYNRDRVRLTYPLAEAPIYRDIATRMPPGVEPPADMREQFPAELGEHAPADAVHGIDKDGDRWVVVDAQTVGRHTADAPHFSVRTVVNVAGPVRWFDADGNEIVTASVACTHAVDCPIHPDATGLHNFDRSDAQLRGALAHANAVNYVAIGAHLTGHLAQAAIERGYATAATDLRGQLVGITLTTRGSVWLTGGTE